MIRFVSFVLALCVVSAAVWYWVAPEPDGGGSDPSNQQDAAELSTPGSPTAGSQASDSAAQSSPFSVTNTADNQHRTASTTDAVATQPAGQQSPSDASASADESAVVRTPLALDVGQIAQGPMSDNEFARTIEALKNDPQLLQQLIDEFRQETDPERRALLALLLGDTGGPEVLLAASELIYSGDSESRKLGLDILQKVQPGNAEARDMASGLLATEVEPAVLIDTLTTLAQPGQVDEASRDFLTEQVAILTEHQDASVRGISLNILSRWTTDYRYTPVLLGGLQDQAPTVRESAAYALVGHEDPSQTVIDSLLAVASNPDERERTRRGSVLALRGMRMSDALRRQVDAIEGELDKQTR